MCIIIKGQVIILQEICNLVGFYFGIEVEFIMGDDGVVCVVVVGCDCDVVCLGQVIQWLCGSVDCVLSIEDIMVLMWE